MSEKHLTQAQQPDRESSDEALVAAAQEGYRQGEEILLERYKDVVRRKATPFFILGADREDVVQEGMIGLFKAIHGFDPHRDARFITYANVCIERQILDAIKKANRKKHEPLNTSLSMQEEGTERLVAARAEDGQEEEGSRPWDGLDLMGQVHGPWKSQFSPLELEVLERRIAGQETKEIAEALERDPKAVYNAMERVKTKLRALVAKR